ncbi:hypothetical protein E1189_16370 [Sansalvadorimonas verongulae]|nr:hypothetical protein [Sansalvadorimonas verongulae]
MTVVVSLLLSGCAGYQRTVNDWWKCALAGGAVGGVGGATESREAAGWGLLGGAVIGGVICAVTGDKSPSETECPIHIPGWDVKAKGCPKDSDGDGVPDVFDKCANTPPGAYVDSEGCPIIRKVVLGPVLFESSSADLSEYAKETLEQEAAFLKDHPHALIHLKGYTDSTGPKEFNQKLSEMRANSTRDFLIDLGVSPTRITIQGYGTDHPAADNKTKEGRQMNRRVEGDVSH